MVNPTINGQEELPIGVYQPSTKKLIERPPTGAENIMDILDAELNLAECMVLLLSAIFFLFKHTFFPNAHFIFVTSSFF